MLTHSNQTHPSLLPFDLQDLKYNSVSATGGSQQYVYMQSGVTASSYAEWKVDVPANGEYMISIRYGVDSSPRPLSVSDLCCNIL